MRTSLMRTGLIVVFVGLLLLVNAFGPASLGTPSTHAQGGGGCIMLGDPIVVSDDGSCTETMVMYGCNCHYQFGIPLCDETHFCLFDACEYPGGSFSFSVFCV
jgi:uncharacterized membrane protein